MKVIIGVDPHKGSHTAVAVDDSEGELARVKVHTSGTQLEQLLAWAAPFEKRTWAVEAAGGWGYLVSQQLPAAGEEVLDVPATLAKAEPRSRALPEPDGEPAARPPGGAGGRRNPQ